MSDNQQFGPWKVEKTLKSNRCYLADSEGRKGVVKIGNNINAEVEILKKLNHPYVLEMIDYDLDYEQPYHVTEYCSGGNLTEIPFNDMENRSIGLLITRINQGYTYFQSIGYVFQNTGLQHILLKCKDYKDPQPVLIDYETCSPIYPMDIINGKIHHQQECIKKVLSRILY